MKKIILMILIAASVLGCDLFNDGGSGDTVTGKWHMQMKPAPMVFDLSNGKLNSDMIKAESWSENGSIITFKNIQMKVNGKWSDTTAEMYSGYKFEKGALILKYPVKQVSDIPNNFYKTLRLERSNDLALIKTELKLDGKILKPKEKTVVSAHTILIPTYQTRGFVQATDKLVVTIKNLSTSEGEISTTWNVFDNYSLLSSGAEGYDSDADGNTPAVFKKFLLTDSGQWQIDYKLMRNGAVVSTVSFWTIIQVE